MYMAFLILKLSSVVTFSMACSVVVVVQEKIFITAVHCKCHRRDAQAREAALESVPSREGARVSPCLTIFHTSFNATLAVLKMETYALAHGSLAGDPDDAANAFGSKPVRFGRGARRMLQ